MRNALIFKVYTVSVPYQRLFSLDFQAHSQPKEGRFFTLASTLRRQRMQLRTTALAASMLIALAGLNACSSTASKDATPMPTLGTSPAIETTPIITQTAAAQAAAAAYDFDLDVFHPVIA